MAFYTDAQVSEMEKQSKNSPVQKKTNPLSGVFAFGKTLGDAIASPIGVKSQVSNQNKILDSQTALQKAIIENKKAGKDTSRLEAIYRDNAKALGQGDFNASNVIPSMNKSNKQIIGEGVSTLGTALLGTGGGASALARVGQGAALGGISSLGSSLEQNKSAKDVAVDTAKGVSLGALISGAFELGALGINKAVNLKNSKLLNEASANIYNKELQTPVKEVQNAIKYNYKTLGEEVRNVVDDTGKPVYVGTYKTLRQKAENELSKYGQKLEERINQYGGTATTSIDDIFKPIIDQMENSYSGLSDTQLKQIDFIKKKVLNQIQEFKTLSDGGEHYLTVPEMQKAKRVVDNLMKDTDWTRIAQGDAQLAFSAEVKHDVREALRKMINEKSQDATIQQLNNRLSTAMTVRDLVARQEAQRAISKTFKAGSGGFFGKFIDKVIDDLVLNPAVTTRASQILKPSGKISPKLVKLKPAGTLLKNAIIKSASNRSAK